MTTSYLGGPMRGYPNFNFSAFDKAAARLRDYGHEVLSPAEHDRETGFDETLNTLDGFDFAAAFAWDLAAIERADIVVFLPGWERSTGCAKEYEHARQLGRDVYAYRPADDDIEAPFGYRLDLVPVDYTPEVDPLDPANPEPHVVDDFGTLDDGCGNEWALCSPDCELQIVRPGKVQCDPCDAADDDDEPLPVTKHILDAVAGSFVHTVEGGPTFVGGRILRDDETIHGSGRDRTIIRVSDYVDDDGFPMVDDACDGETRVTNALTGGQKGTKPARFDLLPRIPLWRVAELYARGAEKYADHNWRKGYDWSLSFAALQRHAWLFWSGEDLDPETGCPHLASVVFHAFAMLEWAETHPELDDRYRGE